jgi:hypothetical protein
MGFESWIDRQIRRSHERGEFEDLKGAGEPLPIDGPRDENWWVKSYLRREGVSYLPPALALRRASEEAIDAAMSAPTEAEVRAIVAAVNERIRSELRRPILRGPAIDVIALNADAVVRRWRLR